MSYPFYLTYPADKVQLGAYGVSCKKWVCPQFWGSWGVVNAELKLVDRTAGHSLMYSFDGSTSIGQCLH